MDRNLAFLNEFTSPNSTDELLLDSEMTGWQPFSTPSRFHMQKQLLYQVQQRTPTNENGPVSFPDEQNQIKRRYTPSSEHRKARQRPENIANADFLSAIPNARQSKTVKRKLNYEDNGYKKENDTEQKQKTYFPFEFIGHATRQSASQENYFTNSNKENERLVNPTTITGYALRKSDVDGSVFETAFTTQSEPSLPQRKRSKKNSTKNKTNSTVALEQHFEQIRRKHAEFNWGVPDSQNTIKEETVTQAEVDIQCVPTTPFVEQYSSPSFYSLNETPLQTSMHWIPAPRLCSQNFEHGRNQRHPTNVYSSNSEAWSTNDASTQDCQDAFRGERNRGHLYPY